MSLSDETMAGKKNWWVTAYDGDENVVEGWMIGDRTEPEATGEAEAVVGAMGRFEVEPGVYVEDWTLREAVVTIQVGGGVVQDVLGLPYGWLYVVEDYDEGGTHGLS